MIVNNWSALTRAGLAKVGQNAREWIREDGQQTRKDGVRRALHAQCQPARVVICPRWVITSARPSPFLSDEASSSRESETR